MVGMVGEAWQQVSRAESQMITYLQTHTGSIDSSIEMGVRQQTLQVCFHEVLSPASPHLPKYP